MKKFIFGQMILLGLVCMYSVAFGEDIFGSDMMNIIPYKYTISFVGNSLTSSDNIITTDTTYIVGTLLAKYVYPRADGFASFDQGSCTDYAAKQRPDLFLNTDGSRRITGNAEDRLRNAKKLGISVGDIPKKGSIAVYYNGRGGRKYGHVAYVEDIQSNGVIIVSEMNYIENYVVTVRAVDAKLAAGYIY